MVETGLAPFAVFPGLGALNNPVRYHAPPEVLERTEITPATDVYSLATTVYALIAGRAPQQKPAEVTDSNASLLLRILQMPVPRIDRPACRPGLEDALGARCRPSPGKRPAAGHRGRLAAPGRAAPRRLGRDRAGRARPRRPRPPPVAPGRRYRPRGCRVADGRRRPSRPRRAPGGPARSTAGPRPRPPGADLPRGSADAVGAPDPEVAAAPRSSRSAERGFGRAWLPDRAPTHRPGAAARRTGRRRPRSPSTDAGATRSPRRPDAGRDPVIALDAAGGEVGPTAAARRRDAVGRRPWPARRPARRGARQPVAVDLAGRTAGGRPAGLGVDAGPLCRRGRAVTTRPTSTTSPSRAPAFGPARGGDGGSIDDVAGLTGTAAAHGAPSGAGSFPDLGAIDRPPELDELPAWYTDPLPNQPGGGAGGPTSTARPDRVRCTGRTVGRLARASAPSAPWADPPGDGAPTARLGRPAAATTHRPPLGRPAPQRRTVRTLGRPPATRGPQAASAGALDADWARRPARRRRRLAPTRSVTEAPGRNRRRCCTPAHRPVGPRTDQSSSAAADRLPGAGDELPLALRRGRQRRRQRRRDARPGAGPLPLSPGGPPDAHDRRSAGPAAGPPADRPRQLDRPLGPAPYLAGRPAGEADTTLPPAAERT